MNKQRVANDAANIIGRKLQSVSERKVKKTSLSRKKTKIISKVRPGLKMSRVTRSVRNQQ